METWKVFVACVVGAFIGTFVSLEVATWLWWIGLLAGGLIGYLTYEWRKVPSAIAVAWTAAIAGALDKPKHYWSVTGLCWLVALQIALVVAVTIFLFTLSAIVTGVFSGITLLVMLGTIYDPTYGKTFADGLLDYAAKKPGNLKRLTLIMILPLGIVWSIWKLIVNFPRILCATGRGAARLAKFLKVFGKEAFLRIHSELRLICGVDAMIGTAIGFFAGSTIIGALAGGLFGVFNYAIVTKLWLIPKGYIKLNA
jgi:uncharacterized membrane protein